MEVLINRRRLGASRINANLYKIGVHVDGSCEDFGAPQTMSHYLLECADGKVSKKVEMACTQLSIHAITATILSNPIATDEMLQLVDRNL